MVTLFEQEKIIKKQAQDYGLVLKNYTKKTTYSYDEILELNYLFFIYSKKETNISNFYDLLLSYENTGFYIEQINRNDYYKLTQKDKLFDNMLTYISYNDKISIAKSIYELTNNSKNNEKLETFKKTYLLLNKFGQDIKKITLNDNNHQLNLFLIENFGADLLKNNDFNRYSIYAKHYLQSLFALNKIDKIKEIKDVCSKRNELTKFYSLCKKTIYDWQKINQKNELTQSMQDFFDELKALSEKKQLASFVKKNVRKNEKIKKQKLSNLSLQEQLKIQIENKLIKKNKI